MKAKVLQSSVTGTLLRKKEMGVKSPFVKVR